MKSAEALRQFYFEKLVPQLETLEQDRLRIVKKLCIVFAVIAGITLVVFLATLRLGDVSVYMLFLGGGAGALAYRSITKRYVSSFKEHIIEQIVHFIDPQLIYEPRQYISLSAFKKSKLFLRDIDVYKGEDQVRGTLGSTPFVFSEVHAQDERRGDKGRRYYVTIFKGLFFTADFNKHFKGQTFVLPDSMERSLGGFGQLLQKWNISRPDLVKLEDVDFEKHFVVYATDQTEARYILSPALMKRLVDFKNKTGRTVCFSFVDSHVNLAISLSRNLFEPKVFTSILQFQPIVDYYQDLSLGLGIVEDLNLNTRIWSKS